MLTTNNQHMMISDVHKLPDTRQIIRYYHATAGFPMKATWLKAIQSTKATEEKQETHLVIKPQSQLREISIYIEDMKHIMYTDQKGQFPGMSSQGNRYIMVLCKTDGSLILVKPMKNRTLGEMCKAYKKLMQQLDQR